MILPNRRRLDSRFPVMAFTISTHGRPWFEVLLCTDRALFDPANAAKRTPANFYAGRQDGGLARAGSEDTAYIVPSAVLKRFADARPRPSEIYFTVAAYDAPEGAPILAQPPSVLAVSAPSVLLGGDFQAHTMAMVLGVPADKLRTVGEGAEGGYAPASIGAGEIDDEGMPVDEAHAWSWSAEDDAAEAAAQAAEAWLEDPSAMALDEEPIVDDVAANGHPAYAGATGSDDVAYDDMYEVEGLDYDEDHDEAVAAYEHEPVAETYEDDDAGEGYHDVGGSLGYEEAPPYDDEHDAQAQEESFDYDDGYRDPDDDSGGAHAAWAEGEESTFPAGSAEPAELADADDDHVEQELAAAEAYDEAYDEAYEEAYDEPYDEGQGLYEGFANGNGTSASAPVAPPSVAAAPPAPPAGAALDIPGKIAVVTKLGRLFVSPEGFTAASIDARGGLRHGMLGFHGQLLQRLLVMMRERDAAAFRAAFGADEAKLPATEDSVRRLRAAGAHPAFQAAQNELAVRAFLDPMLPLAGGFGLDTERALAMAVDMAVQAGPRRARSILAALGPIRTDAQRQQALGALGYPGVAEFQRAIGLHGDGDFGPLTHAAMAGALRRLGHASPVPLPTREQLMDAIVARAAAQGPAAAQRAQTIRTSPEFADAALTWATPPSGPRR
jgi:hypothetical protein